MVVGGGGGTDGGNAAVSVDDIGGGGGVGVVVAGVVAVVIVDVAVAAGIVVHSLLDCLCKKYPVIFLGLFTSSDVVETKTIVDLWKLIFQGMGEGEGVNLACEPCL